LTLGTPFPREPKN